MLTLDLVRHGEAEPAAAGGDASRRLTRHGVAAIRSLGREIAARPARPHRIFASPLVRAWETAGLLAEALAGDGGAPVVETLAELVPEGEPEEVVAALAALGAGTGHVVLVAHMPLLGRLFAHLTGAPEPFAAGALKRIEFTGDPDPGAGRCVLTLPAGA